MSYEFAIDLSELQDGAVHAVALAHGRALLVQANDGSLRAFTPVCPHQMGDLTEGRFDGTCIECPLHDYLFDVRSGECVFPDGELRLRTYAVRVEGNDVYVDLPKAKWKA